jgi:uncharacterized metal-binding protein
MPKKLKAGCAECGLMSCYRREKDFPPFCLTQNGDAEELAEAVALYSGDGEDGRVARAAAEVEGTYYGKLTRVEEIIAFANRIGARRIGIATCIGLMEESRLFGKILKLHKLDFFTAICKVGSVDKTEIGLPEKMKVAPGRHESICNPILQARILNAEKTDLNVIVGLCVGHDSLFIKHSRALVTTLITKDRVLAHNPAGALYTSGFYYQRLLSPQGKL